VSEMRQAVRVGCQVPLPRIRSQGKTGIQTWQLCPPQTSGRLAAKDFVPSVSNASLNNGRQHEESPFSPINLDKGPSAAAMVVELPRFASNCPIANSQTWTGGPVKLLCRENLALSTALSSVMSPSKVQL
jgi:hypothetical protein